MTDLWVNAGLAGTVMVFMMVMTKYSLRYLRDRDRDFLAYLQIEAERRKQEQENRDEIHKRMSRAMDVLARSVGGFEKVIIRYFEDERERERELK
jgi:hypothetical protein